MLGEKNTEEPQKSASSTSVINHSFFTRAKNEFAAHYNTIFNALVNGIGSLISIMYFLAQTSDLVDGLDGEGKDEFEADMSVIGLSVGLSIGFIVTLASIYPHYVLNIDSFDSLIRSRSFSPEINLPESDPHFDLTWKQKLCWYLDFFSHTADSAAPAIFIFDYCEKDPSRQSKIIAQIIATLIGMWSAYTTDLVTCRRNIRLHNKKVFLDSLKPEDTPPAVPARFFAKEFQKLTGFYAGNPLAAKLFANVAEQLEDGAEQLESEEKPLSRRLAIKATPNDDNDGEDHYRLLTGDQDPQSSVNMGMR